MSHSVGQQGLWVSLRWRRLILRNRQAVVGASNVLEQNCEAPILNRLLRCVAFGIIEAFFLVANAQAQDLEPRSYTNTPVGLNFLLAGYVYSEGKIAFDPDLAIADAQFQTHTGFLAYARSLDVWGKSAKVDVVLPYSSFSAHGLVGGEPRERAMSGLGDPRFRFSINLYGAPALSVKEFAGYQQDLIVGVSLQVSASAGAIRRQQIAQPRQQPLVVQAGAGYF